MLSRPAADVDFPEISSVRWIGSGDSVQVLVVRTELRQRQIQLRSPGLFTLSELPQHWVQAFPATGHPKLRSLLHTLTDSRSPGRIVLVRKMKSCLYVTILVSITTIAGDLLLLQSEKKCQFKTKNQNILT